MPRHIALAYIDLLACLFSIFIALFFLSSDDVSKGNIRDVSQFIAEITWNKDSKDDVDIWMRDPTGAITNYKAPQNESVSLDLDDKGDITVDIIRREVISVKSIIPGHYVFNVVMFKKIDDATTQVIARFIKLQPFSIVNETKIDFSKTDEERTVIQFDLSPDGKIFNVDTTSQLSLVKDMK